MTRADHDPRPVWVLAILFCLLAWAGAFALGAHFARTYL